MSSKKPSPVLGPFKPSIQLVPEFFPRGVKRPVSGLSTAVDKNERNYTSAPTIGLRSVDGVNCTCYLFI